MTEKIICKRASYESLRISIRFECVPHTIADTFITFIPACVRASMFAEERNVLSITHFHSIFFFFYFFCGIQSNTQSNNILEWTEKLCAETKAFAIFFFSFEHHFGILWCYRERLKNEKTEGNKNKRKDSVKTKPGWLFSVRMLHVLPALNLCIILSSVIFHIRILFPLSIEGLRSFVSLRYSGEKKI